MKEITFEHDLLKPFNLRRTGQILIKLCDCGRGWCVSVTDGTGNGFTADSHFRSPGIALAAARSMLATHAPPGAEYTLETPYQPN